MSVCVSKMKNKVSGKCQPVFPQFPSVGRLPRPRIHGDGDQPLIHPELDPRAFLYTEKAAGYLNEFGLPDALIVRHLQF